jgi:hypothetical protein
MSIAGPNPICLPECQLENAIPAASLSSSRFPPLTSTLPDNFALFFQSKKCN